MKLRYELVSTVIDAVRHNRYVRHQPCLALLSTGGDERLRETESARTCLTNLIARRVSSESRNDDCVDVYGLAPRVAEERHRACGAFHHLKPRSLQPGRETFEVGGRVHRRIVAPKASRRSSDPSAERQLWRGSNRRALAVAISDQAERSPRSGATRRSTRVCSAHLCDLGPAASAA